MTMSITAVPGLVENTMYPLMFDTYDAIPKIYPEVASVHPVTADKLYGDRGDVLTNVGRPGFVEDGKEIDATEFGEGWTWRVKVGVLKRRLELPRRMLEASDATARITNLLTSAAAAWGEYFAHAKEDQVADQFQKGTLAAGDEVFGASFPNEPDPFPLFIYDGTPWFNAAHPLAADPATLSNFTAVRALDSTGLQDAITQMQTTAAFDERHERIRVTPDTIMVPPALQFTASTLLESVLKPGEGTTTSFNDINTLKGALGLVVNPYLDDAASAAAWWIGVKGKGIRVYDQGAPILEQQYEAKRQVFHVIAYSAFGSNVDNWRYWQANNKVAA